MNRTELVRRTIAERAVRMDLDVVCEPGRELLEHRVSIRGEIDAKVAGRVEVFDGG